MAFRIAVDIGGTFTDGVAEDIASGQIYLAKHLTTQDDPGVALSKVVADLLVAIALNDSGVTADAISEVIHGSTLVTNSLIERKGATTALVATRGTADITDIGREVRYDLYDLDIQMPEPLVPLSLRFEVDERVAADGRIITPLDKQAIEQLAEALRVSGARAVAVALLHACVNPENEAYLGALLRQACPGIAFSLSSDVAREIREYERTTTTIANAYVQPLVATYLDELEERLRRAGIAATLRIMTSSGGSTSAAVAAATPIAMLESGPAGGVLSAANAGLSCGLDDVLAFDMGGTTAKICTVIAGVPSVVHTFEAARVRRFKKGSGLPLLITSIDLMEIGAGGGSIARINDLGLLTVGPESASAEPGPACYGLGGTEPTVTDADLTLGYLNPDFFLGGRMTLDVPAAHRALEQLGDRLSLDAIEVAKGIFNIVNEAMAGAARVHIAEKAQDPRNFTLVGTGGAGPVQAVEIARKLRIPRILFPIAAGTGSCLGFLVAPIRVERSWSKPAQIDRLDWNEIETTLSASRADAVRELATLSLSDKDVNWEILVEMRYVGQG
ncbi:MAG: hydantoinase/oxoprolinase family protein, partial [Rhizobiales bacterium]|nr:hydantoinase/oxoprolinase family protein [Hyphomicrobiales bacterium]